jgi:cytochrome c-type biogenesis protein CcmH/NrfG
MAADSTARRRVDAELGREIEGSPWHSVALSRRARLALFEGRLDDARTYTEGSLRISPSVTGENARLGVIALAQGRPADALEAFRREQRLAPDTPGLDFHMGQAWRRLGDMPRAHAAFTRAIERDTTNREARDSLEALGAAQR